MHGEVTPCDEIVCFSRNQLSVLPVSLCALSSLEVLLASNNKLVSLPEEIGKLERLMDLVQTTVHACLRDCYLYPFRSSN